MKRNSESIEGQEGSVKRRKIEDMIPSIASGLDTDAETEGDESEGTLEVESSEADSDEDEGEARGVDREGEGWPPIHFACRVTTDAYAHVWTQETEENMKRAAEVPLPDRDNDDEDGKYGVNNDKIQKTPADDKDEDEEAVEEQKEENETVGIDWDDMPLIQATRLLRDYSKEVERECALHLPDDFDL